MRIPAFFALAFSVLLLIDAYGHLHGQNFCSSPRVVVGSGNLVSATPSVLTVNFPPFANAPVCVAADSFGVLPLKVVAGVGSVVITGGALVTDPVMFICVGNPN